MINEESIFFFSSSCVLTHQRLITASQCAEFLGAILHANADDIARKVPVK